MTRRGLAIATACAGGFLAFLDTTIVNTAFPGIAASFPDASVADLAWVLDAYFIVIAALLVPAGGIADRIGRRRVFLAGTVLFTAASAACAAAPGLEVLIAARAVQGAGAAVIMAVSLALILPEYPAARRASAVAVWGASAALAAASGPPLGGALVELDWRWVFVVNVPLGALIWIAGRAAFAEQRDVRMTGLPDLLGAALIMAGLGTLSLAILEGGTWGWTSPRVLGAFAASALLLAATARRCLTHPRPVLDPALLRIASFSRANVGIVLLGMAFFSTILANVLFLVGVWGYSVAVAGLAVVPGAIATAAVAVPAGRIAERFGHGAVIVPGCILYVAGMAIVRGAGAEPAFLSTWLPAMALNGAGLGLAFPALAAAALRDVPAEHFGAASAVTSATRQLGGVLGTAVLFAVGAPITLAAAEDAYMVSTLWALGAGVVAATLHGRVLNLGLGAMVVTGALVFAGPAAAQTTDFVGPIIVKPKQVPRLAAAPATDVVVDFETGPALETPITTQYAASAFVSFNRDDAGRPYRKAAPGAARSGTTVANIGADLCELETPDDDCEFPIGGTAGRLTRTASSVRLYAGLFQPSAAPLTVQLIGYRADGTVAATGPVTPVSSATFSTAVSVTSAAADIALFRTRMDGRGAVGAQIGFDDLTFSYPDNALPDVALSVRPGELALEPGKSADVPITVTRLNNSNGPLTFSAAGLPQGVTAAFTGTTLRLTAAANAPRTPLDVARDMTITAAPRDGDVAPAPRSTKLGVRVMRPFLLSGPTTVAVPGCGSLDVALKLERDRAYTGTIKLAAKNVPAGVTATFTPGPDIPAGGPLDVDVRLKLTAAGDVPSGPITIEAGAQPIQITLAMAHSARITYPGRRLIAPRRLGAGGIVALEGDFCPGTRVRVGAAETDATLDGRTLRFHTPRLATSGPLTVLPPGGTPYVVADVEVDTFRSADALAFENYAYAGFSYEEALETFGPDDILASVNPCWPFGSCNVTLPFPDPTAALVVPVLDQILQSTGGHCFGIARAEQGWAQQPASLRRFTTGNAFSIAKTASVSGYLDGQHATQGSAEFLNAWLKRKRGVDTQLRVVRDTLAKGGLPMISVTEDRSGHAVLAYDIVDHADGRADILVADSNVPFLGTELGNAGLHADRETRLSVVRVSASRDAWELDVGSKTWRGGGSTIFAFPRGAIPDNPTLPGLSLGRTMILFGSEDGAVTSTATADDDYLPVLDAAAIPGAAGTLAATSHTVRGVKAGSYSQAVIGDGVVASVKAPAAVGAEDTVRGVKGGVALESEGVARSVTLDVAKGSRSATVETKASGEDTVRLDGSKLVYAHEGKATTFAFTLRREAGTFESGRLRVGDGETVTAKPVRDRVKLTVGTRSRMLSNHRRVRAKLAITKFSVRDQKARVTIKLSGLTGRADGAVVVRAGKTRKVFKIENASNGLLTFTGGLTRKAKKVAKLAAHATVVTGGDTLRRSRAVHP